MSNKPSAIFKRLDQFNKRPPVQDRQPRHTDAEEEQKPAIEQSPAAEPEPVDDSAASTEVIAPQPVSGEETTQETTKEDFRTKVEHPPPDPGAISSADPIETVESADQTKPKSVRAPRPLSQKRRMVDRSVSSHAASDTTKLDELVRKWKEEFRVHSGEIKVLRALYSLTYGIGNNECVTTQEKLAEAANLRRRQCINNVNTLEKMGFIERVEVYNEKGQRGIKLRFYLIPRPRSS